MNEQQETSRPNLPPLRIHHFLVCTAVAAVLLTLLQMLTPPDALRAMTTWNVVFRSISSAIIAASLTLGGLSLYWRAKGYASLTQPGDWLMLSYFFWLIAFLLMPILVPLFREVLSGGNPWAKDVAQWNYLDWKAFTVAFVLAMTRNGLLALFFVWGARRVADTWPWQIAFWLIAIEYALWFLASLGFDFNANFAWLGLLFSIIVIIAMLSVATAIIKDVYSHRQRSWTHWVGASLYLADRLLQLTFSFIR